MSPRAGGGGRRVPGHTRPRMLTAGPHVPLSGVERRAGRRFPRVFCAVPCEGTSPGAVTWCHQEIPESQGRAQPR